MLHVYLVVVRVLLRCYECLNTGMCLSGCCQGVSMQLQRFSEFKKNNKNFHIFTADTTVGYYVWLPGCCYEVA